MERSGAAGIGRQPGRGGSGGEDEVAAAIARSQPSLPHTSLYFITRGRRRVRAFSSSFVKDSESCLRGDLRKTVNV